VSSTSLLRDKAFVVCLTTFFLAPLPCIFPIFSGHAHAGTWEVSLTQRAICMRGPLFHFNWSSAFALHVTRSTSPLFFFCSQWANMQAMQMGNTSQSQQSGGSGVGSGMGNSMGNGMCGCVGSGMGSGMGGGGMCGGGMGGGGMGGSGMGGSTASTAPGSSTGGGRGRRSNRDQDVRDLMLPFFDLALFSSPRGPPSR
jgi:hypothetical protein